MDDQSSSSSTGSTYMSSDHESSGSDFDLTTDGYDCGTVIQTVCYQLSSDSSISPSQPPLIWSEEQNMVVIVDSDYTINSRRNELYVIIKAKIPVIITIHDCRVSILHIKNDSLNVIHKISAIGGSILDEKIYPLRGKMTLLKIANNDWTVW